MNTISGIPAHPLFAHAAVTLVPLAALLVVLVACWPSARTRIGGASPVLALVAAIAAFLTKEAGEYLEKLAKARPDADAHAIHDHAEAGDKVFLAAALVLVVAVVLYLVHSDRWTSLRSKVKVLDAGWMRIFCMVLAVVGLVAAVYTTVTAGHSGAELVWNDRP